MYIEEDTIEELVRSGHVEGPQSLVDMPTQHPVMFYRLARSRVESICICRSSSRPLSFSLRILVTDSWVSKMPSIANQPPPLGCAVRRRLLVALSSHRTIGQLVPVVMRQSPQQLRNGFYYWHHDLPPIVTETEVLLADDSRLAGSFESQDIKTTFQGGEAADVQHFLLAAVKPFNIRMGIAGTHQCP